MDGHPVEANGMGGRQVRTSKDYGHNQVEHDVLFDAIRNDKPHHEAEYGATSTMTAIMGRMATYSGQVVTWDQAFNSNLSLFPERLAWDAQPTIMPNPDGSYPVAMPGVTKAW